MLKIYKIKKRYFVKNDDVIIIKYLLNYKEINNEIYFTNLRKIKYYLEKNHINYLYRSHVHIYNDNNYYLIKERYLILESIKIKLEKLMNNRKFNKIIGSIND